MAYTEILLPATYINANLVDEWDFWVAGYPWSEWANSYPTVAVSAMTSNDASIPPYDGPDFIWGRERWWTYKHTWMINQ